MDFSVTRLALIVFLWTTLIVFLEKVEQVIKQERIPVNSIKKF